MALDAVAVGEIDADVLGRALSGDGADKHNDIVNSFTPMGFILVRKKRRHAPY